MQADDAVLMPCILAPRQARVGAEDTVLMLQLQPLTRQEMLRVGAEDGVLMLQPQPLPLLEAPQEEAGLPRRRDGPCEGGARHRPGCLAALEGPSSVPTLPYRLEFFTQRIHALKCGAPRPLRVGNRPGRARRPLRTHPRHAPRPPFFATFTLK